jgi:hypothetical protein
LRGWGPKKKGGQAEQALGRSKGGFSTKIHVSVDALGNPLRFILTAGQRNDITQAEALILDLDFERLIADKAYDADDFIKLIIEQYEANCAIMIRIFTKNGIWLNVLSIRSSIIVVFFLALRNWPTVI